VSDEIEVTRCRGDKDAASGDEMEGGGEWERVRREGKECEGVEVERNRE
jgi:hypothetical protein